MKGTTKAQLIEELTGLREQGAEATSALLRERVLRQLLRRALEMTATEELGELLHAISHGLQELDVPFGGCGVNLVDATCDPVGVRVHAMDEEVDWREVHPGPEGAEVIARIWRAKKVAYRRDVDAEDLYGEAERIGQRRPIRAILDVPFRQGTLAVNSAEPNAFTAEHIEILQDIAQVLGECFMRIADLRALEQRNEELAQSARVTTALQRVAQVTTSSLEREEILDHLAAEIARAGLFPSLMIALVDEVAGSLQVVRNYRAFRDGTAGLRHTRIADRAVPGGNLGPGPFSTTQDQRILGSEYRLDDDNITAVVARTGEIAVTDGWDDRFDDRFTVPESRHGRVSYFIPVKYGDQVLSVLATGSPIDDKDLMLQRIAAMQPLLDQVGAALEHARLYEVAQHEIAERKQAEEALLESEGKLRTLVSSMCDIIFLLDGEDRFVEVHCQPGSPLYAPTEVFLGKRVHDLMPSHIIELYDGASARLRRTGETQQYEYPLLIEDEELWYSATLDLHQDGERIVVGTRDITERRHAEEALRRESGIRESEASLRLAVARMEQPAQVYDVLREVSAQLLRLGVEHGSCSLQIVNADATDFATCSFSAHDPRTVWEVEPQELPSNLNWVKRTTNVESCPWVLEAWRSGGHWQTTDPNWEMKGIAILDVAFSHGTIGINRIGDPFSGADVDTLERLAPIVSEGFQRYLDLGERKQAEESLLQSSRLIALGQMAAGMAHELNQPLTVISAMAEGLQIRLDRGIGMSPERLRRWSGDVIEGVERMSTIIEHLRTFSRDRADEPKEQVALNDVVRAALTMTQAQLKTRGIEIALSLDESLVPVLGDQYRLEQVLINLIHNARDALEERWEQLSDADRADWQMRLDIRTRREEDRVVLGVQDNGAGMGEEARLQMLDPFYTTKGPDRGTGLGLSISHAIVKDHGGEIDCESQEGVGPVFRVRLPLPE